MEWFPVGCRRGGSGDVRLVFRKKFREILAFLKKIFYNRRQSIQRMSNQPTFCGRRRVYINRVVSR